MKIDEAKEKLYKKLRSNLNITSIATRRSNEGIYLVVGVISDEETPLLDIPASCEGFKVIIERTGEICFAQRQK